MVTSADALGSFVWHLSPWGFALCFVPGSRNPGLALWFSALEDANFPRISEIVREAELVACEVVDSRGEMMVEPRPIVNHRSIIGWRPSTKLQQALEQFGNHD